VGREPYLNRDPPHHGGVGGGRRGVLQAQSGSGGAVGEDGERRRLSHGTCERLCLARARLFA
jgi:hypothetical protein